MTLLPIVGVSVALKDTMQVSVHAIQAATSAVQARTLSVQRAQLMGGWFPVPHAQVAHTALLVQAPAQSARVAPSLHLPVQDLAPLAQVGRRVQLVPLNAIHL